MYATSTDPSATFPDVNRIAADPHMFLLVSEGEQYVFEIAICPDVPVKKSGALPSTEDFNANRITNEQFMKDADLLQNQHLYVRFRDRCFGWENGHTVLATLDLYRRALLEAQPKPATASRGTWSRWWGRGQNRTRTTTGDSVPATTGDSNESPSSQAEQAASVISKAQHEEQGSSGKNQTTRPPLSSQTTSEMPNNSTTQSGETSLTEGDTTISTLPQQKHYAKTLRLTSDQLKALNLKKGANSVSFTVQSSFSGVAIITARIFLWQSDYQVVISDIDGTITKYDTPFPSLSPEALLTKFYVLGPMRLATSSL